MQKILILLFLIVSASGCIVTLETRRPAKFQQHQKVRTVENKLPVTIVGTKCDVPDYQASYAECRYDVRLPFSGYRILTFEESELEEIPNSEGTGSRR